MKKVVALLTPAVAFLSFAPKASAETLCASEGTIFEPLCNPDLGTILVGLINLIFILAVVAALLYLIWGGFKWLISGGDKTAVQGAREHIVAAIVGLVIIFLSYFILNFVIGFFIPDFKLNDFKLPTVNNPSGGSNDGTIDVNCKSNQRKICQYNENLGKILCRCVKK